jgi:DNA-binding SARP family transcriptional activator
MQVRLLGPVDITLDGVSRPVPGLRRQAVLAALALHDGQVVSTDRLVEIVWGTAAPPTSYSGASSQVRDHFSRVARSFPGLGQKIARFRPIWRYLTR